MSREIALDPIDAFLEDTSSERSYAGTDAWSLIQGVALLGVFVAWYWAHKRGL